MKAHKIRLKELIQSLVHLYEEENMDYVDVEIVKESETTDRLKIISKEEYRNNNVDDDEDDEHSSLNDDIIDKLI